MNGPWPEESVMRLFSVAFIPALHEHFEDLWQPVCSSERAMQTPSEDVIFGDREKLAYSSNPNLQKQCTGRTHNILMTYSKMMRHEHDKRSKSH
jgi:hypothetical protein